MDIIQLKSELTDVQQKILDGRQMQIDLIRKRRNYDFDDPKQTEFDIEYAVREVELEALAAEQDSLMNRVQEYYDTYRRPDGPLTKWFSRMLGPLPAGMKKLKFTDEIRGSIPRHGWQALAIFVAVIGIITAIYFYVPIAYAFSPLALLFGTATDGSASSGGGMILNALIAVFILVMWVKDRKSIDERLHSSALSEEQWFRSGAEDWSVTRRVMSCIGFGGAHLVNLIYPVVSVIVLSAVGGMLMLVYLREYRRTGSVELATFVSARVHALYNKYILGTFVLGFALVTLVSFLS